MKKKPKNFYQCFSNAVVSFVVMVSFVLCSSGYQLVLTNAKIRQVTHIRRYWVPVCTGHCCVVKFTNLLTCFAFNMDYFVICTQTDNNCYSNTEWGRSEYTSLGNARAVDRQTAVERRTKPWNENHSRVVGLLGASLIGPARPDAATLV